MVTTSVAVLRSAGGVAIDSSASVPVGRKGSQLTVQPGTNTPTVISGRQYSGHALDQMQSRGITPSVVENTIGSGKTNPGGTPITTRYYDTTNNISVVVDNSSGRVVTARYGN